MGHCKKLMISAVFWQFIVSKTRGRSSSWIKEMINRFVSLMKDREKCLIMKEFLLNNNAYMFNVDISDLGPDLLINHLQTASRIDLHIRLKYQ